LAFPDTNEAKLKVGLRLVESERLEATGGAEGVGLVTTRAVVFSAIAILIFDYILTAILF
jgi:hypothetical protein